MGNEGGTVKLNITYTDTADNSNLPFVIDVTPWGEITDEQCREIAELLRNSTVVQNGLNNPAHTYIYQLNLSEIDRSVPLS
jgi:hypothetical protein